MPTLLFGASILRSLFAKTLSFSSKSFNQMKLIMMIEHGEADQFNIRGYILSVWFSKHRNPSVGCFSKKKTFLKHFEMQTSLFFFPAEKQKHANHRKPHSLHLNGRMKALEKVNSMIKGRFDDFCFVWNCNDFGIDVDSRYKHYLCRFFFSFHLNLDRHFMYFCLLLYSTLLLNRRYNMTWYRFLECRFLLAIRYFFESWSVCRNIDISFEIILTRMGVSQFLMCN